MSHRLWGTDVFHPDLRRVARMLPRHTFAGPRALRFSRYLTSRMPDRIAGAVETERVSPTAAVRIHRPPDGQHTDGALLWIHGGGFVMGVAKQDDPVCADFARDLAITVVSVDYRLAPEHRHPAALEDCYEALKWCAAQPGIDPTRIAIGGASAGGGLAAALALLARERGEITPAFQLLLYPMLDDRTAVRLDRRPGVRRLWDHKSNAYGWSSYLGHPPGSAETSPLAAPSRCNDLRGLPPTWIGVGTLDLLYDEADDYARRLTDADVACTLSVVDGAFHGFDIFRRASVSTSFQQMQTAALRTALLS